MNQLSSNDVTNFKSWLKVLIFFTSFSGHSGKKELLTTWQNGNHLTKTMKSYWFLTHRLISYDSSTSTSSTSCVLSFGGREEHCTGNKGAKHEQLRERNCHSTSASYCMQLKLFIKVLLSLRFLSFSWLNKFQLKNCE